MADRIEREIEEILSRLDEGKPPDGPPARSPIPIQSRRKKGNGAATRLDRQIGGAVGRLTPANLLFAGAGIMIGGLILSAAWDPFIWLAFAGVVLFLAAFIWSFVRPGGAARNSQPRGYYWRDRYIEYEPAREPGLLKRLKRAFRRR